MGCGSFRRSRAAGTRPGGRPGLRVPCDAPAPRAPGRPGTGPWRNHDDGTSSWPGQRRWNIVVVRIPAPGSPNPARRTRSTTRPTIQALPPEELHPCHIVPGAGFRDLDRSEAAEPQVTPGAEVTAARVVRSRAAAQEGPGTARPGVGQRRRARGRAAQEGPGAGSVGGAGAAAREARSPGMALSRGGGRACRGARGHRGRSPGRTGRTGRPRRLPRRRRPGCGGRTAGRRRTAGSAGRRG